MVGIFVANIKIGDIEETVIIVRSDIGAIVKEGDNELIFWAQDFKTKRSVVDTKLTVYDLQGSRKALTSTDFNEEGIAYAPINSNADIGIIEKRNDIAIILINLDYLNTNYRDNSKSVMLFGQECINNFKFLRSF